MSIRVTQLLLVIGLAFGCILAPAAAQEQEPATPQTSLWSVLNLPTLDRLTRPARSKPKVRAAADVDSQKPQADTTTKEPTAAKSPPTPEAESAVASPFSPTSSNRRSAIQKRQLTHETPSAAMPETDPPSASSSVTPHWTPKFAEHAACLQLPDDNLARPVAVNMAGDLIAERITAARAVKKLDPTLNIGLSRAHATRRQLPSTDAQAKSASGSPAATVQLATASPAAAR